MPNKNLLLFLTMLAFGSHAYNPDNDEFECEIVYDGSSGGQAVSKFVEFSLVRETAKAQCLVSPSSERRSPSCDSNETFKYTKSQGETTINFTDRGRPYWIKLRLNYAHAATYDASGNPIHAAQWQCHENSFHLPRESTISPCDSGLDETLGLCENPFASINWRYVGKNNNGKPCFDQSSLPNFTDPSGVTFRCQPKWPQWPTGC